MIRKFKLEDTTRVMTIWTKGNFKAHNFIDRDYWIANYNRVKENYLLKSETYVYVENNEIQGFISLLENGYIGALFVSDKARRKGIGRKLINYCKEDNKKLTLNVYEKNIDAILFYTAMGFKNKSVGINQETKEKEFEMEWIDK